jgi:hypothetical protein
MTLLRSWLLLTVGLCLAEAKGKGKEAAATGDWKEKTNDEGRVVQELKIEAPSMTEEDQYGHKMPDRYKCDSCRAVMFHLEVALKKAHPKSRRMKQWEYTDTFDDACKDSFEGYGIKLHNGENTLSGPGLTHPEPLQPGAGAIQMGGETWGKRLTEACRSIVYERVGEDELYDKYREDGGLSEAICYQDLRDCTTGPSTPPKPKKQPEDKSKKGDLERDIAEKAKALKAEKAKAKKAEKEKTKAGKEAKITEASNSGEKVDSATFLRSLAGRHGLPATEYLNFRTETEWEQLIVAMAGKIFSKQEL